VIGFDDIEIDQEVFPTLTTIRQPAEEIARQAISIILQMRDGLIEDPAATNVLIEPELVVRESCRAVGEDG